MDKQLLISYFDDLAPEWDATHTYDPAVLRCLVELCGLQEGARVLNSNCTTGVLTPYLLEKNPALIVAADFSPRMIAIAEQKQNDPRVDLRCCDLTEIAETDFDCAILFEAFPLYENRGSLIRQMHHLLVPGGRLLICHPEGRAQINARSQASASQIMMHLPAAGTLTNSLSVNFDVDIAVDAPHLYVVSGTRRMF